MIIITKIQLFKVSNFENSTRAVFRKGFWGQQLRFGIFFSISGYDPDVNFNFLKINLYFFLHFFISISKSKSHFISILLKIYNSALNYTSSVHK